MAAVLGLTMETLEAVVEEAGCYIANDNAPGQVVISGPADAVARAIELAKARGARRAMPLPVSAPFHCPLMGPAAEEMARALEGTEIRPPRVPVVCNVSARAETDPEHIRALLVAQVTGRVQWRESLSFLASQGVTQAYEIGPGAVLTGLAKRAEPPLPCTPLGTAAVIEAL